MSYAGIDVGTTNCKITVLSEDGSVIFRDSRSYDLILPAPSRAELSPTQVWEAFLEIVRKATNATNKTDPIEAISFSVLGEAVTPIDNKGQPLSNTLVSMDSRGEKEIEEIVEYKIDPYQIYLRTGQVCHPMYTASKLLWWKNRTPEIYKNTWKFLCWEDFLLFKLCGRPVISFSLASRTMLFDIFTRNWSYEVIEALGLEVDTLPEPLPSGTIVGEILPSIADLTGLPAKTLVVTGGWDQACALLGAGVFSEREFLDSFGTTICVGSFLQNPLISKELFSGGYQLNCFFNESYFLSGGNLNGGVLIKWFQEKLKYEFAMINKDFFDDFLEKLPLHPAQAILIPSFSGSGTPGYNPYMRGAILNLDYQTDDKDLLRALLESLCFEIKRNIVFLENNLNRNFDTIKVVGGGSKGKYLSLLKATVFGKKVFASSFPDASVLGAVCLSITGTKDWQSVLSFLQAFLSFQEYEPAPESVIKIYETKYIKYEKIIKKFEELIHT